MTEFLRCISCKGAKEVLGMGCMPQKCSVCDGVGWTKKILEDIVEPVVDRLIDAIPDIVVKPLKRKSDEKRFS